MAIGEIIIHSWGGYLVDNRVSTYLIMMSKRTIIPLYMRTHIRWIIPTYFFNMFSNDNASWNLAKKLNRNISNQKLTLWFERLKEVQIQNFSSIFFRLVNVYLRLDNSVDIFSHLNNSVNIYPVSYTHLTLPTKRIV